MKPIWFSEAELELTRPANMTDAECQPLPICRTGGQVISCWRPSWRERLAVLFYGRVWLSVLSGQTQPPVWLMGARSPFEERKDGER